MSVRDYAILWIDGVVEKRISGAQGTILGGNAVTTTPPHRLDGPEHTAPFDTTRLDATIDLHGLLPKLSGVANHRLDGLGAWRVVNADEVVYDPTSSGLAASDTQVAIDLLAAALAAAGSGLRWFDVTVYGAVGDGTTDDTGAVNAAIDALIAAGRGVLYFPAGLYKCTGALHSLTVPFTVRGDGSASYDSAEAVSSVLCTSTTADLMTAEAKIGRFQSIDFANTAGSAPTAGSAVHVNGAYVGQRIDFDEVSVHGFHDNLDVAVGAQWSMVAVNSTGPVRYGLRIRNTVNADAGDWSMVDCNFYAQTYDADAGIRIESSGGGKLVNVKINVGTDAHKFNHGIDLAPTASTVILQAANLSVENIRGDGFHAANTAGTTYWHLQFANVEMQDMGGDPFNIAAASAGDFSFITIMGASLRKTSGVNAIVLTNCQHVRIGGVTHNFTNIVSQTGCSDVVILDDNAGVTYASPSITLGSAAAAGAAASVIRSDATIEAFDDATPLADSGSGSPGTADFAARSDHEHPAVAADTSVWVVDPGDPTYDDSSGDVVVSLTSQFGITAAGVPYFNALGVTGGDEAALTWDKVAGAYGLRRYS